MLGTGLVTVLGGLWAWQWWTSGPPVVQPLDVQANPVQVSRVAPQPEPAAIVLPDPSTLPRVTADASPQSVMPMPSPQPAFGQQGETGPLVTHYTARPRPTLATAQDGAQPVAPAAPGGVSFKPLALEGAEAIAATDLVHTIKPTTRALCTLDQAMDTSLPGPFVCHFANDVLAWDLHWPPLIPKDTPVLGSYQPLTTGQGRISALSAQAFRSDGVIIPLGAPITDDLGRMGIPAHVDSRWLERFGNALIVDAAMALVQLPSQALTSRQPGTTNLNLNMGQTESAVSQILNSTLNLPPVGTVNQGKQVMLLITMPIHVPEFRYAVAR